MTRTMLSTALSFTTKFAARAGLSNSSCAPFSLVFPALLNLFFPVPFSFPVFPCPCVPVHRGSCACAPVLFPCIVVPVFVLRLCSCSGVLILLRVSCLPSRLVRFRGLEYHARLLGVRASCLTVVFGHVWLLATSRTTCLPSPSCHL
jgi:hypothetical protein